MLKKELSFVANLRELTETVGLKWKERIKRKLMTQRQEYFRDRMVLKIKQVKKFYTVQLQRLMSVCNVFVSKQATKRLELCCE